MTVVDCPDHLKGERPQSGVLKSVRQAADAVKAESSDRVCALHDVKAPRALLERAALPECEAYRDEDIGTWHVRRVAERLCPVCHGDCYVATERGGERRCPRCKATGIVVEVSA